MTRRRTSAAVTLLGFAAAISAADVASRSIYTFPVEIRKRNYVRLSTETCDECMTLEDFYAAHPLGFVLFYERALMGGHKYKEAIVRGWMEVCEDVRYSRIACGMVDMANDRAYAQRYIDPQTAPAHIVVRNGEPVMALKEQVDGLLAKPGDKATMLAHVADLLKEQGTMGSLKLSSQVTTKEALQTVLKAHRLTIVAFTGEERRLSDAFRAAVQEAVLAEGLANFVAGMPADGAPKTGKGGNSAHRQARMKDKWRISFVAAHGKGLGAHFGLKEGDRSIGAFLGGELQTAGMVAIKADAQPGSKDVLEAVKKIVKEASLLAAAAAQGEKRPEL